MFDLKKWIAKVTQYISKAQTSYAFNLTRASTISGGYGYGRYDGAINVVRINLDFNNGNTAIATSKTLFTIPEEYRPSSTKYGNGIVWTGGASSPLATGARFSVNTAGEVKQGASNNTTRGFAYIEYLL